LELNQSEEDEQMCDEENAFKTMKKRTKQKKNNEMNERMKENNNNINHNHPLNPLLTIASLFLY
jgi:hypothetical protein